MNAVLDERIDISENGLFLTFEVTEDKLVRLLHLQAVPFDESTIVAPHLKQKFKLLELHASGHNQADHHGSKHTGSMPGGRMTYQGHRDYRNESGRKLEWKLTDAETGLVATVHYQFVGGLPMIRTWTEVTNNGEAEQGLEYVSTFALNGLGKEGLGAWDDKMRLHVPHNSWVGEARWKTNTLPELGLDRVFSYSVKRLAYSNVGTWSSSQWVPAGCLTNEEAGLALFWQIEHNGSWHWEIGDQYRHLYLQLSGPTDNEHQWWKTLKPGESFVTVPAAIGAVQGGWEDAMRTLTRYRRVIRRPHEDNVRLPVIFNDFMNCLGGDPTTEKLLPLIDAAAEAGCEYFTIDCGWYAEEHWWDGVGEWLPAASRFPGPDGLKGVIDYIRGKGMVPGLWLEIEVMGIKCGLAAKVPDDWFFRKHGRRVIDNGRYQLDFRNADVRAYAGGTIRRLVEEYGVGYIKMDYNINAGVGTDLGADSVGDGLLEHQRAYVRWLEETMDRYPELIIENCGSGGMRMDYAMLRLHPIQSVTDQEDYRRMAYIAAAAPSVVTPEQSAIWSYPLRDSNLEEAAFNMVNAMLQRVHQSGHLAELAEERFELVKQGIGVYKQLRGAIAEGLPQWPLGMPQFGDDWTSLALESEDGRTVYVAVWRIDGAESSCTLPIRNCAGRSAETKLLFPADLPCEHSWNPASGSLSVALPERASARLFQIKLQESGDPR